MLKLETDIDMSVIVRGQNKPNIARAIWALGVGPWYEKK